MNLVEATGYCFRNALNFKGRADRYEFWNFVFFIFLGFIVLTVMNSLIFGPTVTESLSVSVDANGNQTMERRIDKLYNSGWMGDIFGLIVALPLVAVGARRLHDSGRSARFLLTPVVGLAVSFGLAFFSSTTVPIDTSELPENFPNEVAVPKSPALFLAGWLIGLGSFVLLIVWFARRSQAGANRFGPNPHEVPQ